MKSVYTVYRFASVKRSVNFRLTDADLDRLDGIIRTGAAKDRTEALRLALEVAPMGMAAKLSQDINELARRTKLIASQLEGLGFRGIEISIDQRGSAKSMWSTDTPPRVATTRVTYAWYIDALELGGNARSRCPTLTRDASLPANDAIRTFPDLSMVPAVRTHVCTRRSEAVLNVSVRSLACDSDTMVPADLDGRVCSRTL